MGAALSQGAVVLGTAWSWQALVTLLLRLAFMRFFIAKSFLLQIASRLRHLLV